MTGARGIPRDLAPPLRRQFFLPGHPALCAPGALLDAAVAKAEGARILPGSIEWPNPQVGRYFIPLQPYRAYPYAPSTEWADGGPLVDREPMEMRPIGGIGPDGADGWEALPDGEGGLIAETGRTFLIAFMRAHVVRKLGREVELP